LRVIGGLDVLGDISLMWTARPETKDKKGAGKVKRLSMILMAFCSAGDSRALLAGSGEGAWTV